MKESHRIPNPPSIVRYDDEEWSALYIDGELARVGDSYLIDEYLEAMLSVKNINSNDYFLGREGRYENVAQTLAEIDEYLQAKEDEEDTEEDVDYINITSRAQAEALKAQAEAALRNLPA